MKRVLVMMAGLLFAFFFLIVLLTTSAPNYVTVRPLTIDISEL
jgi:hypothetical protein